jgi:hypothetical protein
MKTSLSPIIQIELDDSVNGSPDLGIITFFKLVMQ